MSLRKLATRVRCLRKTLTSNGGTPTRGRERSLLANLGPRAVTNRRPLSSAKPTFESALLFQRIKVQTETLPGKAILGMALNRPRHMTKSESGTGWGGRCISGRRMFHELERLPRRVLIDTNVLLNASFLREGLARRSLGLLKDAGYMVLVEEQSWQDAKRVLRGLATTSPLAFDPVDHLEAFLKEVGIISVPQSPTVHVPGVNRSDRHLARAAKDRDAWVLTDDAPLVAELTKTSIEARYT